MAIAVNPKQPFDYVLKADRELPPDEQTTFHLRPLSHTERVQLDNMRYQMDGKTNQVGSPQGNIADKALKCGLQGWVNLRDSNGEQVPFEIERKSLNILGTQLSPPTDACLSRLHPDDVAEILEAIQTVQRVTDDEGKD